MNDSSMFPDPLQPESLERRYRNLRDAREIEAFTQAIEARYARQPDDPLLAAWHYRLTWAATEARRHVIAWTWAIPLALLNGLLFWLLTDDRVAVRLPGDNYDFLPGLFLYWMPATASVILIYLATAGGKRWRRALAAMAGLAALSLVVQMAYTHMIPRPAVEQYLNLAAIHLPLLSLAAIGVYTLAGRDGPRERFSLLMKMLEAVFLTGMFLAVAGVLSSISGGLFALLTVDFPDWLIRLVFAGGAGLLPILAVAILYDPSRSPAEQAFEEGLSKVMSLLLRVMLPLSLLVLAVYAALIPFHFRDPLENRDALIVYTAMLFAVIALLLGVTPVTSPGREARWLRRGMMAMVVLALLVGVYALAAILYRAWHGVFTPNRVAFIGWDVINLGLLAWLLAILARRSRDWTRGVHQVFARAGAAYALWALLMLLILPWWFGRPPSGDFAHLPPNVQRAIYGRDYPILLKCYGSPHVYLLERGKKRWVKDIPTFKAQGFRWADVREVPCEDLQRIPDGVPIPPDAGPPPVPRSRFGPAPTALPPPGD